MSTYLDIQLATDDQNIPTASQFQLWVDTVFSELKIEDKELTIRIVDEAEIQQLNHQYRGKDKATNVLSFPFEMPTQFLPDQVVLGDNNDEVINLLGDLIICTQVVAQEAKQQGKENLAHWAHMIVHGTLHLLGYDHIDDDEANVMETLEIIILKQLAIDDPYQDH